MNKFSNLKKLFNEIELLESAGLYKAANVLHKKFVKEAQAKSAKDLMTELNMLAQNPTQDFENLVALVERNLNSSPAYSVDEVEAIRRTVQIGKNQRKNLGTFSTTVAPQNQTLSTNPTSSANPASSSVPKQFQNSEPTAPVGELSDQVKAEQADIISRGIGELSVQEEKEKRLYMNALNDIILAFKEPNKEAGEAIFQQTVNQFQNPKRKQLFINQIDRQRRKYFPQGPFLPEMSNEEGQQLTNLVNQNVAKQNTTQPTNNPSVAPNIDTNNQLYQIVSNFYRSRDVTVTSPEQMYADLKADPARKTVVRNHIRTSRNPNTNMLLALFDSKTK
jgi:hypothetical protein